MSDFFQIFDEANEETEKEFPIVDACGIKIRLLNKHHSLWSEHLSKAGMILSQEIINKNPLFNVVDKSVIEFGAGGGAGLCSISCSIAGARNIISTDYPEDCLIENLKFNTKNYTNISVIGHLWGRSVDELLRLNGGYFDITILCDLIFNTSEHASLLKSLKSVLKPNGITFCCYSHHRALKVQEDLCFFELAKDDFELIELFTKKHPPMFEDDYGDIEIRTTAHFWHLKLKNILN
jgi:nicotinamide N-methyltransferase